MEQSTTLGTDERDHRILQKTLVFSAARLRRAQAEGLKIRYDAKAFSA